MSLKVGALQYLRQAGVDLDATTEGNDGRTAICTAAAEGNTDVVVTLGAAGADFEKSDIDGCAVHCGLERYEDQKQRS